MNPLRVFVTDKEFVKNYIRSILGEEHNVPTTAILHSMSEVELFQFPDDCVIKPTHMSGEIIFRRQGSVIDFEQMRRWFKSNYYLVTRESNYRYLQPKIIVEPYIFEQTTVSDYKIFCLHGRPLVVQVDFNRAINHSQNYYTTDWALIPFSMSCSIGPGATQPPNLGELLAVAAKLSAGFGLVRIDLYTEGGAIVVGEITNCHQSANGYYVPPEGEQMLSSVLFGESGFSRTQLLGFPD